MKWCSCTGLAGIPDHIVHRAREMIEWLVAQGRVQPGAQDDAPDETKGEQDPAGLERGAVPLREVSAPYLAQTAPDGLMVPTSDEVIWAVLREVFGLDIANLTPVQALVVLNDLQQRLRGDKTQ